MARPPEQAAGLTGFADNAGEIDDGAANPRCRRHRRLARMARCVIGRTPDRTSRHLADTAVIDAC
jgi:hypothetical protein